MNRNSAIINATCIYDLELSASNKPASCTLVHVCVAPKLCLMLKRKDSKAVQCIGNLHHRAVRIIHFWLS